jgi:hypothetical protein
MNIFKKKEINTAEIEAEVKKLNVRLELAKGDRIIANYKNLPYYDVNEKYISMIENRMVMLLKELPQTYLQETKK